MWIIQIVSVCVFCYLTDARTVIKENGRNIVRDDTEKTPFTLDEFLNSTYGVSSWNGSWLSDTSFLYKDSGDFYEFNIVTKTSELFLNGSFLDEYDGASVSFSPDQTYVLIKYNSSSVFRHSTTVVCAVYDRTTGQYYDVNNKNAVQLAQFDTQGHGVVYVYENNIYYLESILGDAAPIQVTWDGVAGIIYNGVPDWVYEEEVLGSGTALWFSPDGKHLAYAKFNDTNVKDFFYFLYGTPGSLTDQYPTVAEIKYPKVGETNPVVNVYVYNIESNTTQQFIFPDTIKNTEENNDYVLYGLSWVSNTEAVLVSTNRIQNESVVLRCGLEGSCNQETSYSQSGGWLSPRVPTYNSDGTKRIEILPQSVDDDYFDHLVLSEAATNSQKRLTYGNRVVTTLYGWDQTNNLIYYGGSVNGTPSQNQVYVVNTETGEDKCLTCSFEVDGEKCKYASASFSKSFSYFTKSCSGPNPTYVVVQNLNDENDYLVWIDNAEVREKLQSKLQYVQEDLTVPINDEFSARVRLILPPDLDKTQKYPAIVYVYAGPNSNQINDMFGVRLQNYFVTNRKYIYILIDSRGSGRDGQKKMFQIYRKLGTIEIEDQITVTKYLQDTYSYIDKDNTGIWGWSYGGFASTWALVKDVDHVFKFALSVAPVTSFIYYDTIYTERYMGLPTEDDNLLGYNNTDITRNVEALRDRLYFVIHGNADDNVHYQQTMLLVKALEAADIIFRQQSYPDENHSLSGVSRHLYHTIDAFFAKSFGLENTTTQTSKKLHRKYL
ncbi:venom dipeptidyl peptidase 4 [Sitophilus oryzae]|uniref:Venom dipeptidyl peptidase 4 n=1 Tax=Sitophilus oryzae TaxID=7048 RepID=A0A6J2YD73_SITOR|nr:venom dipeptidyl peptidase 4 [Sitophilus oryzae]